MSKQLLISIKPEHAVNILNGKKTLELRSWLPKNYKGWVNVYVSLNKNYCIRNLWNDRYTQCTNKDVYKINGKVVARFWFEKYEDISFYYLQNGDVEFEFFDNAEKGIDLQKQLCLSWYSIVKYSDYGEKKIYAWHIDNLQIFDKPKELSEFKLSKPPQKMVWVYVNE